MNKVASCLFIKISHYIDIDEAENTYLARIENERMQFPPRRRLRSQGDDAGLLYVVRRGWLYSAEDLPSDRRHIQGLHFPGDIIGISDIALKTCRTTLYTATDVELCPIPKEGLNVIFREAPRIAAMLFAFGAIESAILSERLAAATRLDAEARLAQLFLQIHSRLKITTPERGNWFRMPLSQEVIGDAIGITQAYVHRSLVSLEEKGLIERRERGIALIDIDALSKLCGFRSQFDSIDQSWLPKSRYDSV